MSAMTESEKIVLLTIRDAADALLKKHGRPKKSSDAKSEKERVAFYKQKIIGKSKASMIRRQLKASLK